MKSTFSRMAVVALTLWLGLAAGAANADLIAADGVLTVYDANANLYWLANANLAASNTFGLTYGTNYGNDVYGNPSVINSNGTATWGGAQKWISAMDAANYLGYNDWRLPTSVTCVGYNCTGSEMGNLFYNELGGTAATSILTTHNADLALFNNVQSNYYWSGTAYAPNPSIDGVWGFNPASGAQNDFGKYNDYLFAWAVRPGQVSAAPEPETYVMLLAGLGLIGFMAWRRKNLAA
jgi:hypothetical protein